MGKVKKERANTEIHKLFSLLLLIDDNFKSGINVFTHLFNFPFRESSANNYPKGYRNVRKFTLKTLYKCPTFDIEFVRLDVAELLGQHYISPLRDYLITENFYKSPLLVALSAACPCPSEHWEQITV